MGDETCGNCRSWEEEMYWSHFQFTYFSQFLHSGFDQWLAIPENFSKNLKKKLPETVTLRGPGGSIWEVGLMLNNDSMSFARGWDEFVKDHFLREKDLLIFKYNGDSHFDVLMFDGQSLCEKAASYFVRKCGHREHVSCCQKKRKVGETSAEGPSIDIARGTMPDRSFNKDNETSALGQPIMSKTINEMAGIEVELSEPLHHTLRVRNEEPCVRNEEPFMWDEEIVTKPDVEHSILNPDVVHDVPYVSCRRPVTEEEKQNVLQLARASVTGDGFLQVMKPTHVYRKFHMVIPSKWATRHLDVLLKEDVILRTKENTWRTKFLYQKSRNCGGLSSGWKSFAMDNRLQEFDVCVFEPGSSLDSSIVLDVNIFRVAQ